VDCGRRVRRRCRGHHAAVGPLETRSQVKTHTQEQTRTGITYTREIHTRTLCKERIYMQYDNTHRYVRTYRRGRCHDRAIGALERRGAKGVLICICVCVYVYICVCLCIYSSRGHDRAIGPLQKKISGQNAHTRNKHGLG